MLRIFERGLHSRNAVVRKGCAWALKGPKRLARRQAAPVDFAALPPVLANSHPKSGTHLLDQIVEALPGRRNFGAFYSSMTSSYRFRRHNLEGTIGVLRNSTPGEIVRAHLFFEEELAAPLAEMNFVHYFIYRDPRDVVLSESHFLRSDHRWHRLHPYFRDAPSLDEAISMSIRGLPDLAPEIDYPNIGERFRRYAGWIGRPDVYSIRFEELRSPRRAAILREMAEFYAARTNLSLDVDAIAEAMQANIDPERSHTFRQGQSGGWRAKFTPEHIRQFEEAAGDVLREFGFE